MPLVRVGAGLLVAGAVVELTAYLGNLHREGRLRTDFRPLALPLGDRGVIACSGDRVLELPAQSGS